MPNKQTIAAMLALLLLFTPLAAYAQPLEDVPPFETGAPSVMLIEDGTGTVIFEKNPDDKRPVASVMKIMTLLILFDALEQGRLSLDEMVTVSRDAAMTPGSQAFLDAGAAYSVADLLKSVVISSANDAAVALAEHLLGSEDSFVAEMNKRAAQMGLAGTAFKTCTGLPAEGQFSSARDVAAMSRELLKRPDYHTYSTVWLDELTHPSGRKTELVNTNRLVRFYEGTDGVKTGSTNEAGYCVSASATRDGMRLIAVVLGGKTGKERFDAAQRMLDYGFDHYQSKPIVAAGDVLAKDVPLQRGSVKTVNLVAMTDLSLLTRKGDLSTLEIIYDAPESLTAPVYRDRPVGEAIVRLSGRDIGVVSVVPDQDVPLPGLFEGLSRILRYWPVVGGD